MPEYNTNLFIPNEENSMASWLINCKIWGWPQMVQWGTNGPVQICQNNPLALSNQFMSILMQLDNSNAFNLSIVLL